MSAGATTATRKRWIAGIATIVIVAAMVAAGSNQSGEKWPAVDLVDLFQPETLSNTANLTSSPALVNFWASWCVACRSEHALLMDLATKERHAVNGINYRDERADAMRWINFYGNPFGATLRDADGEFGRLLGIDALPVSFVVDSAGHIRYRHLGPLDAETVREVVVPLLDELAHER